MRNPIRSETDAFYAAVGGALVIAASVALGATVDALVGVALLVGALLGALVWEVATNDPERRSGGSSRLAMRNSTMCAARTSA